MKLRLPTVSTGVSPASCCNATAPLHAPAEGSALRDLIRTCGHGAVGWLDSTQKRRQVYMEAFVATCAAKGTEAWASCAKHVHLALYAVHADWGFVPSLAMRSVQSATEDCGIIRSRDKT